MIFRVALAVVTFVALTSAARATEPFVPDTGVVPNAETAIRIAEAVWIPIYGKDLIASEKPFKAVMRDDVWIVTGADLPAGALGGVAEAHISKRDGRIIRVSHG
ncbi:MAG: NTF2 fold immunity protein, partial [Planctomycetota bacterium]